MAYPKDVMDYLLEAGRGDLASKVARLVYQRAELLEALKKFVKAGQESKSTLEFSNMCDEFIEYAVYAITKAEAAE